jgi:hypothetical protein
MANIWPAGREVAPEGDQVDVDGVEHELDAHQNRHGVLAGQHAVQPNAKQGGGEDEIPGERDHGVSSKMEVGG